MPTLIVSLIACVLMCLTPIHAGSIGRPVASIDAQDYRGKQITLESCRDAELVVLAFLGTECPLAKLYAVRLEQLGQEYGGKVAVIGVDSNVQDSPTEIGAFVQRHGLTYPIIKDAGNKLADLVGAERTPQVFLLDQQRVIRYQGRVDDQYVVGVVRDKPTRADLREAVAELLAGKSVSVAETQPLGCIIGRSRPANEMSEVTYSSHIANLFNTHCVECHRDGEIAPFTLTSYEDTLGWGEMILEVVQQRRMPPWHADPQFGRFVNAHRLTDEEISLVRTWVKNGCPQGNPAECPEPPTFTVGWQLSRVPDVVFEMRSKPFTVPAEAGPRGVAYQNFWVDPKITEDKWLRECEVVPGNRAVVHHIIVYAHPGGRGDKNEVFIAAYVPGLRLDPFPEGAAKKLPAGSWFRFQVHYTPIGTEQEDLSKVGLIFADPEQITHEVRTTEVHNASFEILPGKKDQEVTANSATSPIDVQLLSMSPHMHLRGQSFRYEAEFADGSREVLLDIPRYDFNWQTRYTLAEPKTMPQGTRILCRALYDNTADNLANPDPTATVRWGDQSWDEMMIGYMDVMFPIDAVPSGKPLKNSRPAGRIVEGIPRGATIGDVLKQLDKNNDNSISKQEAAAFPVLLKVFDKVDRNGDGQMSAREIEQAIEQLKQRQQ